MIDFLTVGLFKRDGSSIHFFPFSRKRGYQIDPTAAARLSRFIKAWFVASSVLMIGAQEFLTDPAEPIAIIGGGAVALVIYCLAIHFAVRNRPKSEVVFTREEQRAAVLRAQPLALLLGVGLFGGVLIVGAALFYRDLPMFWPIAAVFAGLGLVFVGWSIRLVQQKREVRRASDSA